MDQAASELRVVDRSSGGLVRASRLLLYRRFLGWTWPAGAPPASVTARVALLWVANPANRRTALLVRQHGPLGALERLLAEQIRSG